MDYLFIHINKTGGTSIRQRLGIPLIHPTLRVNLVHRTASDFINRIGLPRWKQLYTFAIVRNPWDKVVSHYHHRLKTKQIKPISFDEWVKKAYGGRHRKRHRRRDKMFSPQLDWLRYRGKVVVSFIGRFENLEYDFQVISNHIGISDGISLDISASLPHLNKSERGDYQDYYTPVTRDIIANHFKKDIKAFNYHY